MKQRSRGRFTLCIFFICVTAESIANKEHNVSQNTQQILQSISGSQLSMEMLVSESLEFNCKK